MILKINNYDSAHCAAQILTKYLHFYFDQSEKYHFNKISKKFQLQTLELEFFQGETREVFDEPMKKISLIYV